MEWVQVVIGILEIVAIIILGLFLKNYFPSYMDEKGKNLATKEDLAEITRKTEVVQQEFRENFERFSSDIRFKYDFYYRQYTELYCKLYAIVIQSEYVRRFMKLQTGKETSFDEAPFLEISPTRRITNTLKFENGAASKVSTETEEIITPISQFNKKQLCDYIIENGAYSSQKLLKIAMSYRFALKDTAKLFGITIIACCAVFVCTLFLSYNIDLAAIKDEIVTEAGTEMYNAQVLMGRVIAAVSGGCLIATSVVMLLFYVKNYISTHGKELGILKALGYSNIKIARHFWVFGLSVFVGCAVGFVMGYLYLPTFYQKQAPNLQTLIPALKVQFHPLLTFALVGAPTIAFAVISVLFAYLKLKSPVLDLLRERQNVKVRIGRDGKENVPFLKDLRGVTLRSKKSLVFFVAFSAFCFSAMVQMSFSMDELASETFAVMVLSIGLILAFVTLFLSLSSVVKGNTKTIAMMRVFGYDDTTCSRCILGAYRPISYIGFAFGTVYQYGLLRMMVSVVFADIENMPEYGFDFKALTVTLILFVLTYELVMYLYSRSIKRLSVKSVMLE